MPLSTYVPHGDCANYSATMVAKLEGPFHWHKHDETDDFFLVLKGTLDIELRDRTVTLARFLSCPKGLSIGPWQGGEVHILLIARRIRVIRRPRHRVSLLKANCPSKRAAFLPTPMAGPVLFDPGAIASAISLKTAPFRHQALTRGRLYLAAFGAGDLHDHTEQGRASRGA
jgi:hypothetical protein